MTNHIKYVYMTQCSRCGTNVDTNLERTHDYCDDCEAVFDEVRDRGVTVRSRHGNREFRRYPYEAPSFYPNRDPQNQVEALACAKIKMEKTQSRGLFIYQKRGSKWLINEYLDAHPNIAADVEGEIESIRGSKNDGGSWRDLIPI